MLGLIGGLLSSVAGGVLNLFGQNSANQQAQANQQEQEQFEERMSSTAYQRATADMTKAGLNPAAMFGSGGPASTPGVQQAPVVNTMGGPGGLASAVGSLANTAVSQITAQKTIDNLTAQNAQILADSKLKDAQVANVLAGVPGVQADSDLKAKSAGAIKKIPDSVYVPLVQGGFGADTMKNTGEIGSGIGAAAASAKSAAQGVSGLVSDMSGPTASSAKHVISQVGELSQSFSEKWPKLRDQLSDWWNSGENYGQKTYYKQ